MKIKYLLLFIYTCNLYIAHAQIFDDDQAPPSVKWRSIQTDQFQIIYPEEFDTEAQRLTNTLGILIDRVSHSLGKKPRKISIILHSRNVVSNGFVQLAPRRSEFFTTPPQQMDFQDWINSLAIHELRHVVQFDKLTGYLKAPLFEQLAFAIFGITLPPWFYEGDAVIIETVHTKAGRGRLPSWELPFRSNTLSGRRYSYQKNYFGSFKDITPGYYQLGYFMTSKMRRDYGEGFLENLMRRIADNPLRPYNFTTTLRRFTGMGTSAWHRKTVDELDSLWSMKQEEKAIAQHTNLPEKEPAEVANFFLPQALPDGTLLALWTNYHSVPKIVSIDKNQNIKEVIKTGIQTFPHFSYANGKITWDELRYDKRFRKQSYNIINLFDIATGKYVKLTSKTRLFSPALDSKAINLAAVEIDRSNRSSIVIFNTATKKEVSKHIAPRGLFIQTPTFHALGEKIIAVALSEKGSNLLELDLKSGTFKLLLDWQHQQLERPSYVEDGIVFKAHYHGHDNLYFLDQSKNIQRLTSVEFGAFNPSYDTISRTLYFNNYQANGYFISTLKFDRNHLAKASSDSNSFVSYFKPLEEQQTNRGRLDSVPDFKHTSKPYKDFSNLINFHSISPVGDDFSSFDNFNLGLQLLSDNLLNTMATRIGFEYDQNINRANYFASVAYKRWFPRITLTYRNRAQLTSVRLQNQTNLTPLRWRENNMEAMISVPLLFNRLNTIYTTALSVGTSYTQRYDFSLQNINTQPISTVRFPLVAQYYINRNSRRSVRDLAPKWGQNLNFIYRDMHFNPNSDGKMLIFRSTFYFPGVINNHSMQARLNYQSRQGTFQNNNEIPLVSGYDQLSPTRVDNTLLLDYRFPIAYPDWSIGPFAYIKRFKAGFFADFENLKLNSSISPRTYGIELRADLHLLRFYLPLFDIGARLICLNDQSNKTFAVTYGISYSY